MYCRERKVDIIIVAKLVKSKYTKQISFDFLAKYAENLHRFCIILSLTGKSSREISSKKKQFTWNVSV